MRIIKKMLLVAIRSRTVLLTHRMTDVTAFYLSMEVYGVLAVWV